MQTLCRKAGTVGLAAVAIPIAIILPTVVSIPVSIPTLQVTALAELFELMAPLLGLFATFAVLVNGVIQLLFSLAQIFSALVIAVGTRRLCESRH